MSGFEQLEGQLLRSVGERRAARRRGRYSRRTLALIVGGLALSGTAAAAVATLTGEESIPLRGEVPRVADPSRGVAAGTDRYRIGLEPKLRAGQIGWCTTASFTGPGEQRTGGRGCGPAGQRTNPLVASAALGRSVMGAGGKQTAEQRRVSRFFSFAVVTGDVAAVWFSDGGTILPRADRDLPNGWRVAISVGPKDDLALRYITADGSVLPRDLANRHIGGQQKSEPFDPLGSWAVTTNCGALTLRAVPAGLRLKAARRLRRDARRERTQPGAFLSCASIELVTAAGAPYLVGVLIDATDPAARAPELPGTRPAGDGLVESPEGLGSSRLTARRSGRAWVVVKGNSPKLRRALLSRLTLH